MTLEADFMKTTLGGIVFCGLFIVLLTVLIFFIFEVLPRIYNAL